VDPTLPPEIAALAALGGIIERFGLPLIFLIVIVVLGMRGVIRWGPQVDRDRAATDERRVAELAERDKQITFREGLWSAERQARIDAEKALARMVDGFRPVLEGMDDRLVSIEKELLRGQKP
jgi:hypothetical protein